MNDDQKSELVQLFTSATTYYGTSQDCSTNQYCSTNYDKSFVCSNWDCTAVVQHFSFLRYLPAISIHSNSMFWLEARVGVEVAVGSGSVALPVHALHLQGAPQKHPSLTPQPFLLSLSQSHDFPPRLQPLPPGNASHEIGIAG